MENENNNNQENYNNNSYHEHPHGAHPYVEHHHCCGKHAKHEPFMCAERYCIQKLLRKSFKILFALGFVIMVFLLGIKIGFNIGHRGNDSEIGRIHSIPYERSIRGGNSSHQYEIQIIPEHQTQKEYFFKFDN